jgi:hypothetical protein
MPKVAARELSVFFSMSLFSTSAGKAIDTTPETSATTTVSDGAEMFWPPHTSPLQMQLSLFMLPSA